MTSAEYQRRWRAAHPERVRAHAEAYKRRHRDRLRARWAVAEAIRSGRLVRPEVCEECGTAPGTDDLGRSLVEAHHPDPLRRLLVRWLCRPCHQAAHRSAA